MSIYTDMVPATLQESAPVPKASGAPAHKWVDVTDIQIAIYKIDSFKSFQNAKYEESTHNGLTFFKDFDDNKEYRIVIGTTPMDITYFNTTGRITTLLLKQVSMK